MTQRLVRCREGHVYDADAATACPVCGDASTRGRAEVSPSHPTAALEKPPYAVLATGAVAVIGLIAAAIWLLSGSEPPPSRSEIATAPARERQSLPSTAERTRVATSTQAPRLEAETTPPAATDTTSTSKSPADRIEQKPAAAEAPAANHGASQPTNIGGPVVADPEIEAAGAAVKSGPLGQPVETFEKYPPPRLARIQQELALSDLVVDAAVTAAATTATTQAPTRQNVALLEALASRGSTSAMVAAANAYFRRSETPTDVAKGIRYLEDAAEAGFGPARLALARILLAGESVKPDKPRAILLLIAAKRGSIEGAGPVLSGLGLDPEKLGTTSREVITWAVQGDRRAIEAARELMTAKISGGSFALAFFGAMRSQDPKLKKDVLALAQEAAKLGEVGSYHLLSVLSEEGKLAPKNPTEAVIWADLYRRLCPQCTSRPERMAELERRADKARLVEFNREVESLASSGLQPDR